ncbi:ABC-three component system middle component 2 [Pseudomonas qingdaonensis]|uniref:ABC-three component system middle component 2 n=1 Tax=Pseudomonas qingdaonensis TaxID=2056231 RepID=UPI001E2B77E9|nr:ABC-three component system middle component 2 [Pseudomonas qingdaonensis]
MGEEEKIMNAKDLYNSPVEIGARIVLLLDGLSRALDLDELIFLDYASIYSGDFQGEPSLHPMMLNRLAELVRRREIFPSAIELFTSKGLMTSQVDEQGVRYSITNQGSAFAAKLTTDYHTDFRRRVVWVEENIDYLAIQRRTIYKVDKVV